MTQLEETAKQFKDLSPEDVSRAVFSIDSLPLLAMIGTDPEVLSIEVEGALSPVAEESEPDRRDSMDPDQVTP